MRRIEARQSLLLKKLEEIEAVWMEKREGGESGARQTPASSHTFRCGQYLRPLRKATGFDRDIYGYEPPGIAGGGLSSAFASSAEKLTAEEIGP